MKTKFVILILAICRLASAQNITADFTSADAYCLNSPSCFTDLSTSNNGAIILWTWDFGDSNSSTLQNPCHDYLAPGTYSVCLTVQNINGDTNTTCKTISIFDSPTANFSYSINGNVVTFVDLSSGASSWNWDFFPGNPVYTDSSIIVTYPPGSYNACLIVSSQYGCLDTTCQSIIISSINEINSDNIFNISPNPFSTQTILQANKILKNSTLTLFNSIGRQVKEINNISGQTFVLDCDNLSSGLYYLYLTEENKTLLIDKLIVIDK